VFVPLSFDELEGILPLRVTPAPFQIFIGRLTGCKVRGDKLLPLTGHYHGFNCKKKNIIFLIIENKNMK
jgi:hypothetical protein